MPKDLDELYRGIVSLAIAWSERIKCNMMVNGEISVNGVNGKFDHIGFEVEVPLDLKMLMKNVKPRIIIEDSRSKRRLLQRKNELQGVNMPKVFLHVALQMEKNFVLSLSKINSYMYRMEVNV